MPHLITTDNRKISLADGKNIVGRDVLQCQIALTETFVSRLQAVIEINRDGQAAIKNLSSRQSTFVNGVPVDTGILRDGDTIEFGIGQFVALTFHAAPANNQTPFMPHFAAAPLPSQPLSGAATMVHRENATDILRIAGAARLHIGRAADNEIVLDAPGVSRRHAELVYEGGDEQPVISDAGSTNGTFVNGEILRDARRLLPTDWITVGGYLLRVKGREVKKHDLSASRLTAFNVGKSYGDQTVLQNVSVAFYPREFVGLMGASGCGKSTLMDALNGMRPASCGQVFINDLDLYQNFDLLRRSIGYVPQRDVLHESLTVERTLFYAAKMRLPHGATGAQISEVIAEVIQTVGLQEQRKNAFRQLSGGQQKRLSLGIELITKPNFLFLDEPTSPLDPETTENMMMLFRKLADEGRIVVMVTHKFEKFNSMHNIVLLTKGGRLAFFGAPHEALKYFNCQEPSEIYRRLNQSAPEDLCRAFQNSPQFQKNVAARFNEMHELTNTGGAVEFAAINTGAERKFGFAQWLTLTRRLLEIKLNDFRNTLILLVQAPLVALILALITDAVPNDGRTIFIAAVIAVWLGANNAIREIVAETGVYSRERLVNLKIPSYVFSKFTVLSLIGLLQCVLFVLILTLFGRFDAADFKMLTLILYLTLLAGAATGLFFSALVSSTEKAMSILPLILIPQLLLSGFLKPLDDLYVNLRTGKPAAVADYDKYEREKNNAPKIDPKNPTAIRKIADPIQKSDSLGKIKFFADLMTARWTIDALAHQVSRRDYNARDKLAARMTVAEYENVLQNRGDAAIDDAYQTRINRDLLILAGFSVLFLLLTVLILKQKDSL